MFHSFSFEFIYFFFVYSQDVAEESFAEIYAMILPVEQHQLVK